jgi:DNA segregation ATPase FtsK/SpoIIIE, S-DNA-T family
LLELLLRVEERAGRHRDVAITYTPDHTVGDVAAALALHLGMPARNPPNIVCERIEQARLTRTASMASSGMLTGDTVRLEVLGALTELTAGPRGPALLSCDVVSGPSTGRLLELRPGRFTIGRDPGCDLHLEDPTVSARQVVLEVADDGATTIAPAGPTTNPTLLDGVEVVESMPLDMAVRPHEGPGANTAAARMVRIGATTLAIRVPDAPPVVVRDRLGLVPFNRTPYRRPAPREREIAGPGQPPIRAARQQLRLISILLSIAVPAGFALVLGRTEFLVFAVIGPVGAVVNRLSERRSGTRTFKQEAELFTQRRTAWLERLDAALDEERRLRTDAAPDIVALTRRAERRSPDLWPRPRDADDFLVLRIGLGRDEALTTTTLPQAAAGDTLSTDLAEELRARSEVHDVPVSVDLRRHATLALHGDARMGEGMAAAMLLQAATLHSPEDLIVCAALHAERDLRGWLDWLPHTRSVGSPLPGRHVAIGDEQSGDLLRRLLGDLAARREAATWPRVLLCLDERVTFDGATLSALLEVAPFCGVSVIWLGDQLALVPRQASAVLDCPAPASGSPARLWFTDPELAERSVDPDVLGADAAGRAARALAPVRDASGSSTTNAIPRIATLLESMGVSDADPADIVRRWEGVDRYALRASIGIGPNGPFEIDLVEHGPHGLIAGTSGSGKSELLQSLIASLVVNYPPTRLNLLFIDYKGGASSNIFQPLPHTVGYVTNLEADLAMRALTSLRAELDRRMRLLEGKAKDLADMLAQHPDEAPASLVIVVDEFATLVKEIPDFVTGMVDIAQRGRSLGIHLILATQRPTGAVNDNILANTNLRISLRVLDPADSTSILGGPDAAHIPAPLRGRGFARLGTGGLLEFQSAYSGAPFRIAGGVAPVEIVDFPDTGSRTVHPEPDADEAEERTHLEVVVSGVVGATAESGHRPGRRPWLEDLPSPIDLADVLAGRFGPVPDVVAGRHAVIGVVDEPETQTQRPYAVDLEASGGLLILGSGGSGRTTTLRTVLAGAIHDAPPSTVEAILLDFGGRGLEGMRGIPHVAMVAPGDEAEPVTRAIAFLVAEVARRQVLFGEARSENLTAYNGRADEQLARILVLIDGLDQFLRSYEGGDRYVWPERLIQIALTGRSVGIHVVATADRRAGIPAALFTSISERLALRTADRESLVDVGIPSGIARSARLGDGRALLSPGIRLQIAVDGTDLAGAAQARSIGLRSRAVANGLAAAREGLPEDLELECLPVTVSAVSDLRAAVGIGDVELHPVFVDLTRGHLVIAGPGESGRSSVAALVVAALAGSFEGVTILASANSPIGLLTGRTVHSVREEHREVLEQLLTATLRPEERPHLLVLDRAEDVSPDVVSLMDRLIDTSTVRIVAVIDAATLTAFGSSSWLSALRRTRRIIVLGPDEVGDLAALTSARIRLRPGLAFPPGRGLLVEGRRWQAVQFARHPKISDGGA